MTGGYRIGRQRLCGPNPTIWWLPDTPHAIPPCSLPSSRVGRLPFLPQKLRSIHTQVPFAISSPGNLIFLFSPWIGLSLLSLAFRIWPPLCVWPSPAPRFNVTFSWGPLIRISVPSSLPALGQRPLWVFVVVAWTASPGLSKAPGAEQGFREQGLWDREGPGPQKGY